MSVIRVGSSAKYADGWDLVFGRAKPAKGKAKSGAAARKARKTTGGKAKARAAAKPAAAKAARPARKKSARKRR